MKRNSEVVQDDEGKRIVVIHNIPFKGRQNIDWDSVENYIRRYIGQFVEIMDTGDTVGKHGFQYRLFINDYFFSIDDRRYNFYNFFGFHLFCDYLIFDTVIFKFSHIHIIVARRFVYTKYDF